MSTYHHPSSPLSLSLPPSFPLLPSPSPSSLLSLFFFFPLLLSPSPPSFGVRRWGFSCTRDFIKRHPLLPLQKGPNERASEGGREAATVERACSQWREHEKERELVRECSSHRARPATQKKPIEGHGGGRMMAGPVAERHRTAAGPPEKAQVGRGLGRSRVSWLRTCRLHASQGHGQGVRAHLQPPLGGWKGGWDGGESCPRSAWLKGGAALSARG